MGIAAEAYVYQDPNSCIFKLGLFGEKLTLMLIEAEEICLPDEAVHADRLTALEQKEF